MTGRSMTPNIDWDRYDMEQYFKNHPGLWQHLVQTSSLSPKDIKLGTLIVIGSNPNNTSDFFKNLFVNANTI